MNKNMTPGLWEFYNLACGKFGADKFSIKPIQISDESLDRFKVDFNAPDVTREQIEHYRQVWLKENKCPNCGADLTGLFSSFNWGIVHGEGYCSECKKVEFRLYHYIGGAKKPFEAYALCGF
jgi:hypothetical protein